MSFLTRLLLISFLFTVELLFADGATPLTATQTASPLGTLSEVEKEQVKAHMERIRENLSSAIDASQKSDWKSVTNMLRRSISDVLPITPLLKSNLERFSFGLALAGEISTKLNHDRLLAAKVLEVFISVATTNAVQGLDESLRLVLLQQYYHLGNWQAGAEHIRVAKTRGVVSSLFAREALGFCNGMIANGGLTNDGPALFASLVENKSSVEDLSFSYGSSLLSLSHLYSLSRNYQAQLKTLNNIVEGDEDYYRTNIATVSYFRYAGYKWTGDSSNSLIQLVMAAKAAQAHPEYVTDEKIRETLPRVLKQYQEAGLIDTNLHVVFENIPGITPTQPSGKRFLVAAVLIFSLIPLWFIIRMLRKRS